MMTGSVPHILSTGGHPVMTRDWLTSVRTRRIFAYLIDIAIIFLIQAAGFIIALLLAIPTLGLTALAFGPLAATPLIGILYSGLTVGGPRQSTFGQRAMDLVTARQDNSPIDFLVAASHALLFYVSIVFLSPLVLIVSLIDSRKRLLHDIVLGIFLRRNAG